MIKRYKNIFNYNTGNYIIAVPYVELDYLINDEVFKKYFIIDLRNEQSIGLFKNFDEFQHQFLCKDFFVGKKDGSFDYTTNMELLFVYDKHTYFDKSVENNINFALKRFVTSIELEKIISNLNVNKIKDTTRIINIDKKEIELKSFNLIDGDNCIDKTILLKKIAFELKSPIFNLTEKNNVSIEKVNNHEMHKYMKLLKSGNNTFSFSESYFYLLSHILAYNSGKKETLLLDDLCFMNLDYNTLIKVIDVLSKFSMKENDVILTNSSDTAKSLVKSRVYNPNIIEL